MPAKRKAPKTYKLSILGTQYSIKLVSPSEIPGLDGLCDFSSREIKINRTLGQTALESTLLHEVIHAILYMSGMTQIYFSKDEEGDEGIVLALEHGLAPLVRLKWVPDVES